MQFIVCLIALSGVSHAALEFENTELELETGLMDKSVEAVFRFTNTGDKPVAISDVRSSCGCTVPTLEKEVYEPGDTGEIKALFTIGGRTGKQHKSISFKTDDPDHPSMQLSFTTTIPEWCRIEPRIIRWMLSAEGTPQEITLEIVDPERIQVELVEDQFPETFSYTEVSASPEKVVYAITPKSTESRITGKITLMMTATDGNITETRETYVYCLIR